MSSLKIVYWSGTGNTKSMADSIAMGAKECGTEVDIISVSDVNVDELLNDSVFLLGCPSMGAEELEETEMEPFMQKIESKISGKKIGLFGSYGWGNEEWMRDWEERVRNAGAIVINDEGITTMEEPDDDCVKACVNLGTVSASFLK